MKRGAKMRSEWKGAYIGGGVGAIIVALAGVSYVVAGESGLAGYIIAVLAVGLIVFLGAAGYFLSGRRS
jgi:hypothetical protein